MKHLHGNCGLSGHDHKLVEVYYRDMCSGSWSHMELAEAELFDHNSKQASNIPISIAIFLNKRISDQPLRKKTVNKEGMSHGDQVPCSDGYHSLAFCHKRDHIRAKVVLVLPIPYT